jgi:hypothetical protein
VALHGTIGKRTRGVLGGSGVLLFVCMFLPAVKVCDQPRYPTQAPLLCVPYEFGLACAIVAVTIATYPHVARWAMRAAAASLIFTGSAIIEPVGAVPIVFGATMLWVIGGRRVEIERGLAGATMAMGVAFTMWFFVLAIDDAMYGVALSLAGTIGILTAGAKWVFDLGPERAEPTIPRATARER